MTDRSKFEQMLEHLINEDQDKATELFHQLVVEKSRQIYKEILSESFEDDFGGESEDDFGDSEGDIGGDASDDFIDDIESDSGDDSEYGSEESEGELEDRVIDLEDALDDLRAEFEELMAQESGEGEGEDFGSEDNLSDFEDSEEESGMDSDMGSEDDSAFDDEFKESFFREYVEKVTVPKGGDDGANTKSVVAKPNRMGGTSANIARGGEEKTGGTKGGLLKPSVQIQNANNQNVKGGKAGNALTKVKTGHGAEKKGSANPAPNTKSVLGGKR